MHAKPFDSDRWRRHAKRVAYAVGLVVLMVLVLYAVTRSGDNQQWLSRLLTPAAYSETESKLSEAVVLRERLQALCWQLRHRREEIVRTAEQERIAYRIMRRQGLDQHAARAQRLAERQEHWRRALEAMEEELTQAERLLARLESATLPNEISPGSITMDPQLKADVWTTLRLAERPGSNPIISDLNWSGGADAVMGNP